MNFNTIKPNNNVDNAISNLVFLWIAVFKNGDTWHQKNHSFKEIKQRMNELSKFTLYSYKLNKYFIANLLNASISDSNNNKIININNTNVRLIYFRRINGITNFNKTISEVSYFIGYQYKDIEQKNTKILIQIFNNGKFIII